MYAAVASATGGTACSQPLSTLTGTSSAKAALQPQQKNKRRRGVIGTEGFTGYRIQETGYRSQEFRSSEWAGAASDFWLLAPDS